MVRTIGERIREYRKSKYMSVRELADAAGLHDQTIYNYEIGSRPVSNKSIKKIAEALEVEISDLVG